MTRAVAGAVLVVATWMAGAVTCHAQVPDPDRSRISATRSEGGIDEVDIDGELQRLPDDQAELRIEREGATPGCDVPGPFGLDNVEPQGGVPDAYLVAFSYTVRLPCNGHYRVTARSVREGQQVGKASTSLELRRPAQPVTGLAVSLGSDRSVTVSWDGRSADYTYEVDRVLNGEVTTASTSATTFDDPGFRAPASGDLRYRVRASREGVGTAEAVEAVADLGSTAPASGPTAVSPGGGETATAPDRPASGRPGLTTPHLPAAPQVTAPPRTLDNTTFLPEIDFADREPGEEDPVLPEEDLSTSSVQRFTEDEGEQRSLLVPAALALILVVGALHLRHLTRLANRPAPS
ncbi:hypothetical protein BH24ACT3_BH24ACT3_11600 [soil metagenome]